MSSRKLVIVGLGNYTHPHTKHSVGQVLLKNLALKAASIPGSKGSPHLQPTSSSSNSKSFLGRNTSTSWTTRITVPLSRDATCTTTPTPTAIETESLEILFVLPKALMNVCGRTIVTSTQGFLPPLSIPDRAEEVIPTTLDPPDETVSSAGPERGSSSALRTTKKRKQTAQTTRLKPIPNFLVLVDDLDLVPGSTRVQRGGGPKGHNGIRSLISASGGSKDFWRFWIGIGRPEGKQRGEGVAKWVLSPLDRAEVRSVEWNEEERKGGEVLENAWREIMKIGCQDG